MTKLCDDEGCPHHGTPHVCHGPEFQKFKVICRERYVAQLKANGLTYFGTQVEEHAIFLMACMYEEQSARVTELLEYNNQELEKRRNGSRLIAIAVYLLSRASQIIEKYDRNNPILKEIEGALLTGDDPRERVSVEHSLDCGLRPFGFKGHCTCDFMARLQRALK